MMNKTKKGQSTKAWDVVPEVGEYDVKYEEYTLKIPNIVTKLSQDEKPFLAYGEEPMIDCEFDDDNSTPDYLSYKLPHDCTETKDQITTLISKAEDQNNLIN